MLKMIKSKNNGNDSMKSKKTIANIWFITIIVLTMMSMALLSGCSDDKKSDNSKETANTSSESADTNAKQDDKKEEPKKEDTKITYENFTNIKIGQSYDEVKALLGDGKESSSSDDGGIKTIMYEWQGSGIGNISITFQNGAATIKAQAFLKDYDAKITMDKYNQIQNGMTYEQVKGILGDGELSTETKIMDSDAKLYSYINKDGSIATFNFSDGKLDTKSQYELK
ncbi:beta-lactamase-inhibitor protein BLIP [Clostridium saccharoperbutylacetonicum]|uniref:beta-lactamase-inhibitor protein BLIP n=1 Tax=Clostridium saccharoperbutylacetonicum TaxID=36745 RepID=UPI0039E7E74A